MDRSFEALGTVLQQLERSRTATAGAAGVPFELHTLTHLLKHSLLHSAVVCSLHLSTVADHLQQVCCCQCCVVRAQAVVGATF